MRNPIGKQAKATRLLESARTILVRQGRVSDGFGTPDLTCAIGALGVAYNGSVAGACVYPPDGETPTPLDIARKRLDQATEALYGFAVYLGTVNDTEGLKAVLPVYDYAIAHE